MREEEYVDENLEQILEANLEQILEAAGCTREQFIKVCKERKQLFVELIADKDNFASWSDIKSRLVNLLAKDAGNLEIKTFDQQNAFMEGLYIGIVLLYSTLYMNSIQKIVQRYADKIDDKKTVEWWSK